MRKLFFVLMAVAAIAMTGTFIGCEKTPINDPEPEENFTTWGGVHVESGGSDTVNAHNSDEGNPNHNFNLHPDIIH